MNASDISIEAKFLLDNTTGPVSNIKDTTDYAGLGISTSQVKGNVTAKYGATIFHTNADFSAPDINRSVTDNVSFFLPLDSLLKVIVAAYVFIYKVKILAEEFLSIQAAGAGTQVATTITGLTISSGDVAIINGYLTDPDKSNVKVRFIYGSTILAESPLVLATTTALTFDSVDLGTDYANIDTVMIIADTLYSKEFTYNYCDKSPKGLLDVSSDCLRSQLTAKDITNYPATLTSSTRVLKLQWPRLSNGNPVSAAVTTSGAAITIGPNIYSGNYTITLTTVINWTQTDGLLIKDTVVANVEHNVVCSASLCKMAACINSLRSQYEEACRQGSARVNELSQQNFRMLLYFMSYQIAISCGDTDQATIILNSMASYLKNEVGATCGCSDTVNQGEPSIIYATVTDSQTPNLLSWN